MSHSHKLGSPSLTSTRRQGTSKRKLQTRRRLYEFLYAKIEAGATGQLELDERISQEEWALFMQAPSACFCHLTYMEVAITKYGNK